MRPPYVSSRTNENNRHPSGRLRAVSVTGARSAEHAHVRPRPNFVLGSPIPLEWLQMTRTLQKALARVSKLPKKEQEAVGKWLLGELDAEQRWDELFERSRDRLAELSREALREHRSGRSKPLDPESL